ncbi:MAG: organomercurial lyase [Deferrisomatales bacterium]
MTVDEGVKRLQGISPLQARQAALPEAVRRLHRRVLTAFAATGAPPTAAACAEVVGPGAVAGALAALAAGDLVVRGGDGAIQGAYPFTLSATPHRVTLGGHTVHAMCALDALAIAPMFAAATVVESACEVTGEPVRIEQAGMEVVGASPGGAIHVGIRWGEAQGAAANSL